MKNVLFTFLISFIFFSSPFLFVGCERSAPPLPDRLILDKYASGDGQCAFQGETLPERFQVVFEGPVEPGILGGEGTRRGIPNARVHFEVENPETGAVFTDSEAPVTETFTDAGGAAFALLRLGNWCGDVWVKASTPDYPTIKPVRLRAVSGVRQIGKDLENVTEGVIEEVGVELRNSDGTPAQGVEVYFRVEGATGSGSSVKNSRVISDEKGRAVTSWKLGNTVRQYFLVVQIHDTREDISKRDRFEVVGLQFEAMAMNKKHLLVVLAGGLAIFIYGMTMMSRGLQRIADQRLKAALNWMTYNRFVGVLTGVFITGLIQSSSATTVMLVGVVNAGMVSLTQALGVVFGANIGTTVTAQLIAFRLDSLAYPAITTGLLMTMLMRNPRRKALGDAILGFGLLFLGMNTMSDILKPLRYSPEFISWFAYFDCTPGPNGIMPPWPVFMCIVVGTFTTCIIQSSSATMGIVLALCSQGILNFYTAVPIILGENIGTTITANLAALNANKDAKRVALAHTFFNLFGTAYMYILFFVPLWKGNPLFLGFVDDLTPGEVFSSHPENLLRHAANAHTFFNVINTFIFLPFTGALARFCQIILPVENAEKQSVLNYLEPNLLQSPSIALERAVSELIFMIRKGQKSINESCDLLIGGPETLATSVLEREELIDRLQKEIIEYLVLLSRGDVTPEQSSTIPLLIHMINDAERLGDHGESLVKIHHTFIAINHHLSPEAISSINQIRTYLNKQFEAIYDILEGEKPNAAQIALDAEKELSEVIEKATEEKVKRLDAGLVPVQGTVIFLDVLAHLERVGDHLVNIAERAPEVFTVIRN